MNTEEMLAKITPQEQNDIFRLTVILQAIRTEPEDAAPRHFFDAMTAEQEAGTLSGERLHGYLAAIEATMQKPGTTFNHAEAALSEMNCDFRTLEVTLDRLFNDTLPPYREQIGELNTSLLMELDAATDIYNVFSERIRDAIDESL